MRNAEHTTALSSSRGNLDRRLESAGEIVEGEESPITMEIGRRDGWEGGVGRSEAVEQGRAAEGVV